MAFPKGCTVFKTQQNTLKESTKAWEQRCVADTVLLGFPKVFDKVSQHWHLRKQEAKHKKEHPCIDKSFAKKIKTIRLKYMASSRNRGTPLQF